ncbi:potassium channel protein [Fervidobacterium sp. 2310opik-2]|uniref:potassium channel family protein n=1 Tax=Fervidobacterium sp. 2310opik-2 TaxID=1755815 RepID=UPI001F496E81|nr:potassium channel protein [Fervidobacterium sp. 2310opik-2]
MNTNSSQEKTFEKTFLRRITISIIGILVVFLVGTFYYFFFEKYSLLESIFFTAITLSTVGYGIPRELSAFGKIFTIFLILIGLSFVLYSISYITAILVEGELNKFFKTKRIERRVSKMKNHIIVVGVGNIGTHVVNQLLRYDEKVVAIDKAVNENAFFERIHGNKEKLILINGDATNEETLLKAGIREARALITTLPDDSLNVFVALTAKNLNNKIYIVSNINNLANLTKFIYAGVDYPIATAEIASIRIVETVIGNKPKENVIDILNIKDKTFRVEIVDVENTKLSGGKIEDLKLKEKYNIFIVGVINNEKFLMGPSKDYIINPKDKIILFGESSGLENFRKDFLQ